ncbi:entry exclusion protein TrbK [Xanthobacter sp. DSM 24535]
MLIVGGLIAIGASVTIWIAARPASAPASADAAPAIVTSSDSQRRERAEKFLGGNPNIDVRGGQEMRPRW